MLYINYITSEITFAYQLEFFSASVSNRNWFCMTIFVIFWKVPYSHRKLTMALSFYTLLKGESNSRFAYIYNFSGRQVCSRLFGQKMSGFFQMLHFFIFHSKLQNIKIQKNWAIEKKLPNLFFTTLKLSHGMRIFKCHDIYLLCYGKLKYNDDFFGTFMLIQCTSKFYQANLIVQKRS